MNITRKVSHSVSSPSGMRRSAFTLPQYSRRFSVAGVRLPVSAGRLWDPVVLDRLKTPLTRFRD
jgi:hypothetical protein